MQKKIRMGYLISRYPAISHTFILREVRGLRELGFEIETASINCLDRPMEALTGDEKEEVARTFYVKSAGWRGGLAATWTAFFSSPTAYLRGLWFALRMGGTDPRRMVFALFYLVEAALIGRWMKQNRLDHLHVHFATPAAMVGLIATRLFPFTFSMTVHGPDEFYDTTDYRLREKIAGASFITCISSYARSQLMKLSPVTQWSKFDIARLGVFPSVFAPETRKDAGNQGESFEILCVGRLVPAKGQQVLIAAVERLVKEGRRVRLRLIGDGPDRAALEAEVARRGLDEHVIFAGAVNQDRIREFYARADVFALASFAEGVPVVLMEAMAMEIPCVSTCITGIPELIRPGQDGLLVPPSDEEALATALARLMDEPELRVSLGRAGRQRVESKYNLERNIGRLAEIFRHRLANQLALSEVGQ